jgi:hypothetical protein
VLATATVLVVVFWDRISSVAGNPADQAARDTGQEKPVAARPAEGDHTAVVNLPSAEPKKDIEEPPNHKKVEVVKKEPEVKNPVPPEPPSKVPPRTEIVKKDPPRKQLPAGPELFPRRALAISVSNYLLANPLHYGVPRSKTYPGSSVRAVLTELGNFHMKVPNTQLFEVSDAAPRAAHAPVKDVLESTIADFLHSSREQDRIVLLFAGHAVEIEKEAYLVPIDAAVKDADAKTLISFAWLYERLKECKARQKVLIVDVCRFDPARGEERPGSGVMGDVLDAKLQQPPTGVQVWSSCIKGQQAYEFEKGSVFLQALCAAMQERVGIQYPNEPLPLEVLVPRVNKYMDGLLRAQGLAQTSRLVGTEPKDGAPYDPSQPLSQIVTVKPPAMPPGGMADAAQVRAILDELKMVPPVRSSRDTRDDLTPETLPPFPAKVLEPYKADYTSLAQIERNPAKYPLRVAILKAAGVLRDNAEKVRMKEVYNGNTTAQIKKQVLKEQVDPGKSILALKEALEDLKKAGEERAKEPSKRWQANYDYVLARLESRLVYIFEYNYVLAQIRSESLPPLENGATGYRLGARKKVGVPESEVRDWVKEIDRTWQRLARDHANTPWAVVANRERLTVLGLEWRPTRQ